MFVPQLNTYSNVDLHFIMYYSFTFTIYTCKIYIQGNFPLSLAYRTKRYRKYHNIHILLFHLRAIFSEPGSSSKHGKPFLLKGNFIPQHILPLLPLYNAQWRVYESLTAIVLVPAEFGQITMGGSREEVV